MILRDNVYGTIDEDVIRRDFTVNALYYNIKDFSIVDFVGGMQHIAERKLHLIGNAETRYREDPVRMLRAVRLSAKLALDIDEKSRQLIPQLAHLIQGVPKARLWDESLKLFLSGHAKATLEQLSTYQLFELLFPLTHQALQTTTEAESPSQDVVRQFIQLVMQNTDKRIAINRPVTPAFFYAAMLWYPLNGLTETYHQQDMPIMEAFHRACGEILAIQHAAITIPRRFAIVIREIWAMQFQLNKRNGRRAEQLLSQARFRAAYDFLLLRAEAGEPVQELSDWWTQFQEVDDTQRRAMVKALTPSGPRRRRRPPRKNNKRNSS